MNKTKVKQIAVSFFSLLAFCVSVQGEIEIQNRESVQPYVDNDETIRELAGTVRGKTTKHSVALIDLKPKGQSSKHYHPQIEETYFVLSGEGLVHLGNEKAIIKKGDLVVIPPNTEHQVFNQSNSEELRLLVVAAEPWTQGCQVYVH